MVTGAAGYLGRELCLQLLQNWQVTALVREASETHRESFGTALAQVFAAMARFAASFACRIFLYSLSGVACLLFERLTLALLVTFLWSVLELAAVHCRCRSVPFLFRLLLSYVLTGLCACYILMSRLDEVKISTISVVLPCANESFVQRTVQSIMEATPEEELLEIIIVDDASWPPATGSIKSFCTKTVFSFASGLKFADCFSFQKFT